jgi:hypothetical protein
VHSARDALCDAAIFCLWQRACRVSATIIVPSWLQHWSAINLVASVFLKFDFHFAHHNTNGYRSKHTISVQGTGERREYEAQCELQYEAQYEAQSKR